MPPPYNASGRLLAAPHASKPHQLDGTPRSGNCGIRTEHIAGLRAHFEEHGFAIFRPCSLAPLMDTAAEQVRANFKKKAGRFNESRMSFLQYKTLNMGVRSPVNDGDQMMWKSSKLMHDIATNEEVRRAIQTVHSGRNAMGESLLIKKDQLRLGVSREEMPPALPMQQKAWLVGSMVPAHSDVIYHDTLPRRGHLVGTWLALEDVHPAAGPLQIYPGSHRGDGYWDFATVGLATERSNVRTDVSWRYAFPYTHVPKASARTAPMAYMTRVKEALDARQDLTSALLLLKKGEILIWAAPLLHRGMNITQPGRTRLSVTTHYMMDGFEVIWTPQRSLRHMNLSGATRAMSTLIPVRRQ